MCGLKSASVVGLGRSGWWMDGLGDPEVLFQPRPFYASTFTSSD